jgi:hypothetical protein
VRVESGSADLSGAGADGETRSRAVDVTGTVAAVADKSIGATPRIWSVVFLTKALRIAPVCWFHCRTPPPRLAPHCAELFGLHEHSSPRSEMSRTPHIWLINRADRGQRPSMQTAIIFGVVSECW